MIVDSWPGQELSQPFSSPGEVGSAEAGMGKVPHGERENMGISSTIASQTVSSKGTRGAQGGRTGICSELT